LAQGWGGIPTREQSENRLLLAVHRISLMSKSEVDEEYARFVKSDVDAARRLLGGLVSIMLPASGIVAKVGFPTIALITFEFGCLAFAVAAYFQFVFRAPSTKVMMGRYVYSNCVVPFALMVLCLILAHTENASTRLLSRGLFYFVPPVALTREVVTLTRSDSMQPWFVYIIMHFLASSLYAASDVTDGVQLIIVLLVLDIHYFDVATTKLEHARKSKRDAQRSQAHTVSVLSSICDAVVVLDFKWTILSESRFAAMLGRTSTNMKGRRLAEFVYWEDNNDFLAHAEDVMESKESFGDCGDMAAPSMSVRLSDAYANPVAVNVFHVCHRSSCVGAETVTYTLGLNEAWNARKSRRDSQAKSTRRFGRNSGEAAKPPETGFLLPLADMSSEASSGQQRSRGDSPRPHHSLGLGDGAQQQHQNDSPRLHHRRGLANT